MSRGARTGRAFVALLISSALLSCASGSHGEPEPEPVPSAGLEPSRQAVTLIVTRAGTALERGDTVRVDLSEIEDGRRVRYLRGTRPAGWIPLAALGPTGADTMVVSAARANVYRCRSRGCTVLGYVVQGELAPVHDFAGGWFRYAAGDSRGYIHADDLVLPLLYRRELLERLRGRTASYYESSLTDLRSSGGVPLFNGHEVRVVAGMLSFEFYASRPDAEGAAGLCDAMRGIARFVEGRMAEIPAGLFDSYSAGVYVARPGGERGEMIAGLAAGSDVYCEGGR